MWCIVWYVCRMCVLHGVYAGVVCSVRLRAVCVYVVCVCAWCVCGMRVLYDMCKCV